MKSISDCVGSIKSSGCVKSHFGLYTLEGATEKPMPRLLPGSCPPPQSPGPCPLPWEKGCLLGANPETIAVWGCWRSSFVESRVYCLNMLMFVKALDGEKGFCLHHIKMLHFEKVPR